MNECCSKIEKETSDLNIRWKLRISVKKNSKPEEKRKLTLKNKMATGVKLQITTCLQDTSNGDKRDVLIDETINFLRKGKLGSLLCSSVR